jgi:hypothetical protein
MRTKMHRISTHATIQNVFAQDFMHLLSAELETKCKNVFITCAIPENINMTNTWFSANSI